MGTEFVDVLVVGGGPAGGLVAGMLADWGRSALLVHGPERGTRVAEETMVGGAWDLLDRLELLQEFRDREWLGTPRHGVIWGSTAMRWREGTSALEDAGFKVPRAELRELLRRRAGGAGARVVLGSVTADPQAANGAWTLRAREGPRTCVQPRVVVMATGKGAPAVGAGRVRVRQRLLPAMVALSASIERPTQHTDATVIESVPEGWWWWLPLRDGTVSLTLFADAQEVKTEGQTGVWNAGLRAAVGPARTAVGSGPAFATVATPQLRRCDGECLLIGDAASTVDPLSSQGLEKGLASAEEAAYVVNTWLEHPAQAARLREHQASWEEGLFAAHAQRTGVFYAQEVRWPDAPFWRARCEDGPRHRRVASPLPARLRRSPDLQESPVACRRGRLLEWVPGWRLISGGPARSQAGRVPIGTLLDLVEREGEVEAIVAAASREPALFVLTPGQVKGALAALHEIGFLVGG